jgi:cytochrome P450
MHRTVPVVADGAIDRRLMIEDPQRALDRLREAPPGLIALSERPTFAAIVTDPQLIQDILLDTTGCFQKGPGTLRFRYALGDGTATSQFPKEGSKYYWPLNNLEAFRIRKRQFIVPAFAHQQMSIYAETICQCTVSFLSTWQSQNVYDMYTEMTDLMLQIMVTCLFDRDVEETVAQASRVARTSMQAVDARIRSSSGLFQGKVLDRGHRFFNPQHSLFMGSRNSIFRERHRAIHMAIERLLNTPAKTTGKQKDLLSLLLSAQYKETNTHMSRNQIINAAIGLFFAGYENSSAAAAWVLWFLATHPDVQERAASEVEKVNLAFDKDKREPFPYLQSCIDEALRLRPPVWSTARETMQDRTVGQYRLPQGSVLILSPWLQHHRPAAWPNPDLFSPERFFHQSVVANGNYFPFGSGVHSCIGKSFALLELRLVIAAILQKWNIESTMEDDVPQPMLAVTQRPYPYVRLRVTKRSSLH